MSDFLLCTSMTCPKFAFLSHKWAMYAMYNILLSHCFGFKGDVMMFASWAAFLAQECGVSTYLYTASQVSLYLLSCTCRAPLLVARRSIVSHFAFAGEYCVIYVLLLANIKYVQLKTKPLDKKNMYKKLISTHWDGLARYICIFCIVYQFKVPARLKPFDKLHESKAAFLYLYLWDT